MKVDLRGYYVTKQTLSTLVSLVELIKQPFWRRILQQMKKNPMEGHLGRFKLGTILNTGLADSMQIIKADLWDAIQAACKNVYSKHIESPTNSLELQTYDTNLREKTKKYWNIMVPWLVFIIHITSCCKLYIFLVALFCAFCPNCCKYQVL